MRYKRSNLNRPEDANAALSAAREQVRKVREGLREQFLRLGGRNFGAYQSREIDGFFATAWAAVKFEYFGDFEPSDEQIPICVLALGSYAFNEINFNSKVDFAVIYKDLPGFNAAKIARAFVSFTREMGIDVNPQIYELSGLFLRAKDDNELKALFGQIRFVCASKKLYKAAKDEIARVREYEKEKFFAYHLGKLAPFDEVLPLSQRPNLKTGYGGFYDFKRVFWLLNALGGNPRERTLKWLGEKQSSEFNLAADFISSLRTALGASGGDETLEAGFLAPATALMQTKEKRSLNPEILTLSKTLAAMKKIALYSRYVARSEFSAMFNSNLSFLERKIAKNGAFYVVESAVRTPLHAPALSISNLISNLNALPDVPLKFAVEAVVFIQKTAPEKSAVERVLPAFKRLLYREHSHGVLKALLDSELLFELVRPLAPIKHLAAPRLPLPSDEFSVDCVFRAENTGDKFALKLWRDLCAEGRACVKLALLMHRCAEEAQNCANVFRAYAVKLGFAPNAVKMGVAIIKNQDLLFGLDKRELNLISHLGDEKFLAPFFVFSRALMSASKTRAEGLEELYKNALNGLKTASPKKLGEAAKRAKKEGLIKKQKSFATLPVALGSKILAIKSNLIFAKYSASEIIKIALWAEGTPNIAVECENDEGLLVKIISKRGWNLNRALEKLAGLDLEYMEFFELFDNKFYILLQFKKSAPKGENTPALLVAALCESERAKPRKYDILEGELTCDFEYSPSYAKITLNAKDALGLLSSTMAAFEEAGLRVANARIQTIKGRSRNLFLVEREADLAFKFEKVKKILVKE